METVHIVLIAIILLGAFVAFDKYITWKNWRD